MLKKLIVSAAVAVSAFTLSQTANAKTNVTIGIGVPGVCVGNPYYCQQGPGWGGYDGGYGYDDDGWEPGYGVYHQPRRVDYRRPFIRDSLRCKEARWLLEERGWRNVRARDCNGVSYTFTASRRGVVSLVRVNSHNGRITSIRRLSH